jgi:hypothetical protein
VAGRFCPDKSVRAEKSVFLRSGQRKICLGRKIRAKIHDGTLGGMSNNSLFCHFLGYEYKT